MIHILGLGGFDIDLVGEYDIGTGWMLNGLMSVLDDSRRIKKPVANIEHARAVTAAYFSPHGTT